MQTSPQTYQNNFTNSNSTDDTIITENKNKSHKKLHDGIQVGNQFIQYFYSAWMSNPDIFVTDDIIKPYTKIAHNNITYEGSDFLVFLKSVATNGLEFSECKWEIIDSGSRQIYILVNGIISNAQGSGKFSQSFMIAFMGQNNRGPKSWALVNSIFILE